MLQPAESGRFETLCHISLGLIAHLIFSVITLKIQLVELYFLLYEGKSSVIWLLESTVATLLSSQGGVVEHMMRFFKNTQIHKLFPFFFTIFQ